MSKTFNNLLTLILILLITLILFKPELFSRLNLVVEIQQSQTGQIGQSGSTDQSNQKLGNGPFSYADAVERAAPAVVNIHTKKTVVTRRLSLLFDDPFFHQFFGDRLRALPRKRLETSLGSGVILSKQGYLLTNNHVIEGADEIEISLHDGRTTSATLIGSDPETDLALLHIGLEDLPTITLGHSEQLRVGDVVLAIGNPFGVGQTVTMGIVSATHRNQLGISERENFIQTDAAINPGNSGGALVDAAGNLVGINTAIFSRTGSSHGIGFAIPVSTARAVMTQLIEHGTVQRGWLGIEVQDLTPDLAESFDVDTTDGVILSGIYRHGPAAGAEMQLGDVLTHINGQAVKNTATLESITPMLKPGSTIEIRGIRKGQPKNWKLKVVLKPKEQQ